MGFLIRKFRKPDRSLRTAEVRLSAVGFGCSCLEISHEQPAAAQNMGSLRGNFAGNPGSAWFLWASISTGTACIPPFTVSFQEGTSSNISICLVETQCSFMFICPKLGAFFSETSFHETTLVQNGQSSGTLFGTLLLTALQNNMARLGIPVDVSDFMVTSWFQWFQWFPISKIHLCYPLVI
jgi:hypothetical protein